MRRIYLIASLLVGVATPVRASEQDVPPAAPDVLARDELPSTPTRATAGTGSFLSFSLAADVESSRAYAVGLGGYDTARNAGTFEASTEARLWGPLALRAGAVYSNEMRSLRPSVGARVQALRESRHGVDGAVGVLYRPEGLTEPEGEVETVLSVGRHAGAAYLLGNLVYGQDPEGNERDGEVRLAVLGPAGGRTLLGLDGRFRFDLGSQAAKLALHHEATLDVLVGPSATIFAGPIALLAHGGPSVVRFAGAPAQYGAFVMAGAGAAF
jgi:hypothetical protein